MCRRWPGRPRAGQCAREDLHLGAVLAEQNDEWTEQRRYMGLEILAKARLHVIDGDAEEEVTPTAISA
jgi:hypothetical protein